MNCPTCDTVLTDDHALGVGDRLVQGLNDTWWSWTSRPEGFTKYIHGVGTVTLLAKKTEAHEEQGEDHQEVFMVFAIEDKFYKKLGYGDSYGEVEWDGPFKEVKKVTKTVEDFE